MRVIFCQSGDHIWVGRDEEKVNSILAFLRTAVEET